MNKRINGHTMNIDEDFAKMRTLIQQMQTAELQHRELLFSLFEQHARAHIRHTRAMKTQISAPMQEMAKKLIGFSRAYLIIVQGMAEEISFDETWKLDLDVLLELLNVWQRKELRAVPKTQAQYYRKHPLMVVPGLSS